MSAYYLDSSAIVKRYVRERGSAWVVSITDIGAQNEVLTTLMSGAEVVAAICKSGRTGSITPQDVVKALATFKSEFRTHFVVINISDQTVDSAMTLAEKHGLRGYDSVQLATALELKAEQDLTNAASPLIFVGGDNKLNAAAQAEGLLVENPNNHP